MGVRDERALRRSAGIVHHGRGPVTRPGLDRGPRTAHAANAGPAAGAGPAREALLVHPRHVHAGHTDIGLAGLARTAPLGIRPARGRAHPTRAGSPPTDPWP